MYQIQLQLSPRPISQRFILLGFLCIKCACSFNNFLAFNAGSPAFKGEGSDGNAVVLPEPTYTDRPLEQFSNTQLAQNQNTQSSPDDTRFFTEYTNPVAQFGRDVRRQPLPSYAGSINSLQQIGALSNHELEDSRQISSLDSKYMVQRPGAYSTASSLVDPDNALFGVSAGNNFQQQTPRYTGPEQEPFSPQGALQAQQDVSRQSLTSSSSSSNIDQLLARIKSNRAMQYSRQGQLFDQNRPGMAWNAEQEYQRKEATQLGLHDLHSAVEGLLQDVDQLDHLLGQGQLGNPSTVQQMAAVQTGSIVQQQATTTTSTWFRVKSKREQMMDKYLPYVMVGCIVCVLVPILLCLTQQCSMTELLLL